MELIGRTVSELVAEDYRRATVFKKHGIDFCCGGGRTVETACVKKGISVETLVSELEQVVNTAPVGIDQLSVWDPETLVEFTRSHYHTYFLTHSPIILEFIQKVARVHGNGNPEVISVFEVYSDLTFILFDLIQHVEQEIFPLLTSTETDERIIKLAIQSFEQWRHQMVGQMKMIRSFTSDYIPPDHACMTYRVSYAKLAEFEEMFDRYFPLATNLLFPLLAGTRPHIARA